MDKVKTQYTTDLRPLDDNKLDYYELAVYFAAAKAREEEFRWDNFIDNLSYICDKFASHIQTNNATQLEL